MKKVAVIPARYGSTRFPGKPLAKIHGKEMILWVVERVAQAKDLSAVIVATDDERIASLVKKAGHEAVMTRPDHPSGSDRIFEAVTFLSLADEDIIINVQGDEPLVEPEWLTSLSQPLLQREDLQMSSLAHDISAEELVSTDVVKVLINQKKEAIYFSRFPVPFSRQKVTNTKVWKGVYKHMGFYAYRKAFLGRYCQTAASFFEQAESLEQLRALDMGAKIGMELISGRSWGVDSPDDIARIEKILGAKS